MTEPISENSEYKTDVGELEAPMLALCEKLKPLIENQNYSLIVGEDVSGRIPVLIVKGFADEVARRNETGRIPLTFVTTTRNLYNRDRIIEHEVTERVLPAVSEGKKVLFVTDYINTGQSLLRLVNQFKQMQIPFDVAALRINPFRWSSIVDLPDNSLMLEGEVKAENPPVWSKNRISGFIKQHPRADNILVPEVNRFSSEETANARDDVKVIVGKAVARSYPVLPKVA